MYAFLVVVQIILPNQETHNFEIHSRGQFAEPVCQRLMKDAAARASDHTARHIRFASVVITAGCHLRPTRAI